MTKQANLRVKDYAMASSSLASLVVASIMLSTGAVAQPADNGTEQVVVTGSRVARDGFQAPTPVTVLGADFLNAKADVNIADSVTQLPQFSEGNSTTSQPTGIS